jgi:colanic acid biosynthesis glycosyl transferase WcaI
VFDYSGHPGQIQLSRELARRGHEVLHLHCPDYQSGKGDLSVHPDDAHGPGSLTIDEIRIGSNFARYSPTVRIRQELKTGRLGAARILAFAPDVAVLSNIPLLGHALLAERLNRAGVPMVFWHQDIYSRAIGEAVRRKLGPAGPPLAAVADGIERRIARLSRAVVPISAAYLPTLRRWGVPHGRTTVIPNWGPVAEIVPRPRDNAWAARHDLQRRPVAMYTGTLGLKHDPRLLLEMAERLAVDLPEARVVVVSEGQGRGFLEEWTAGRTLEQLELLDFQPYEDLPDVLGAADLVVAMLEPEAGVFSVPSKVLTYLCAGRPILGVMPPENQAALMIGEAGAGWITPADRRAAAVDQLVAALADTEGTAEAGRRGRKYAESAFSIRAIGEQFERILSEVASERLVTQRSRRGRRSRARRSQI